MGASFRNKGEIIELAGCDLLTISLGLLGELLESSNPVDRKLSQEEASKMDIERIEITEKRFVGCLMKMRWQRRKPRKESAILLLTSENLRR